VFVHLPTETLREFQAQTCIHVSSETNAQEGKQNNSVFIGQQRTERLKKNISSKIRPANPTYKFATPKTGLASLFSRLFIVIFSFISYTFLRFSTEIDRLLHVRAAVLKFRSDH